MTRAEVEALTLEEGRALAEDAADHLTPAAATRLLRLVCYLPGVLDGLHARLLDAGILDHGGWVWRGAQLLHDAPAPVRDRLVAMVPDVQALLALAWIGDGPARAVLRAWNIDVWLWAGWELLDDGSRRELHWSVCHRLVPGAEPSALVGLEEACGGCLNPMTAAFDLDLTDDRLSFLGLPGTRLRLGTCLRCVERGTVFVRVDGSGGCAWSDQSAVAPDDGPGAAVGALALGERRRTPFGGLAFDVEESSQLGGLPIWEQSPEYPACPDCGERMSYLGQVRAGVGTVYAFLDPLCGTGASIYQQD